MGAGTGEARGGSRLAVLLAIALGLAVLVAWLLLGHRAPARGGDGAPSRAAASAANTQSSSATPASTATVETPGAGAARTEATTSAAASNGIGFTSTPAPSATTTGRAAPDDAHPFPRFWRRCFLDPAAQDDYLAESDSGTAWSGSWSLKIASRTAKPRVAGAGICQAIAASTIQGHRIRITLHMRTQAAVPGAHMLFRVEGADGRLLAFYNMEPRWVSGTRDWAAYTAVLDVPAQAAVIVFGGVLVNTGTLWVDDALLEFVGRDVGVTRPPPVDTHYNPVVNTSTLPKALQNPGFEQLEGAGPSS